MRSSPAPLRWTWPRIRLKPALALLAFFTLLGLWQGATVWLASRAQGGHPSGMPFFIELTATWSVWAWMPLVHAAATNAPRPRGNWPRFLGIHAVCGALFAFMVSGLFLGIRRVAFGLLGWGRYRSGDLAFQLPMEWLKLLPAYAVAVACIVLAAGWKANRELEMRRARLEAELKEAQLQVLSAQLDPHFLFNALNTISSVMYEDLDRTDRLLASLGQMLRDGLESGGALWPLGRELAHLEAFLDFALARFGERLKVETRVAQGLGAMPVPRFCLQRLVENALKHNAEAGQPLSIAVGAGLEEGVLCLSVSDDGRGFPDPGAVPENGGLGLRNLREALRLQYGPEASLEVADSPFGGARVSLRIPAEATHA